MYQPYPGGTQLPEPSRPPIPQSVRRAVQVMYAGAVASLISIIIDFTTLSSLKSDIESRNHSLTPSGVNSVEHAAIAGFVISGLIGAALWLWMAQSCKAGKGWARIVSTVLFGLDTVAQVVGASSGLSGGGVARIFSLLVWLIGMAAVILLWQRRSSDYFKGMPRY